MFFKKKYHWKKIADSIREIPGINGGLGVLDFEGRKICLAAHNGRWHAFPDTCPHAGAPLSEGLLDGKGGIECPLHGAVFNISNGYNSSGEGYKLTCWKVEERGDGLYICLGV